MSPYCAPSPRYRGIVAGAALGAVGGMVAGEMIEDAVEGDFAEDWGFGEE
ncbi:hypothetical protein [Micromonospora sp. Rc5]|nr:hypothetical protein [Micromonospora sp. Rc5]